MRITVGVSGGIAAYKASELVRALQRQALEVNVVMTEAAGKSALAAYGVQVPQGRVVPAGSAAAAASDIGFPVVIKAVGAHLEHKTEVGGVILNVRNAAEATAAKGAPVPDPTFLPPPAAGGSPP